MPCAVGDKAPDFQCLDDRGEKRALAQFAGDWLVLYFYPKDATSGCTKQACAFRQYHADFTRHRAHIVGVSKDSVASHQRFRAAYDLPFPLLSDEDGAMCSAYGVWVEKSMYGRKYMGIERSTFIIDGDGIIRRDWRKVRVRGHVEEVLGALDAQR